MSKFTKGVSYDGRWLIVVALLGVGYLIGLTSRDGSVQAEVRRSATEHQHFQSGAQRSEVLLQRIAATLGTMDGRLDRIEKLAAEFAATSRQPPAEGANR